MALTLGELVQEIQALIERNPDYASRNVRVNNSDCSYIETITVGEDGCITDPDIWIEVCDNEQEVTSVTNMTYSSDDIKSKAKSFYHAYGASAEWKNYQGNPMPSWYELPANIQRHWFAVAEYQLKIDYKQIKNNYIPSLPATK